MASFLESLLSVPTVSGGEKALTDKIDRYIKKYTDETHTDALGNLIATRHALSKKGKKPLKLAFFCAVDAPGRIVTYVEEDGLVRTAPIGKTSAERAVYTEVAKTDKKYTGILIPDNGKTEAAEPLYADFGFANAKEAAKHLSLGDLLCFVQEPVFLGKTQLCAPALGNKLCAAALAGLPPKPKLSPLWKSRLFSVRRASSAHAAPLRLRSGFSRTSPCAWMPMREPSLVFAWSDRFSVAIMIWCAK